MVDMMFIAMILESSHFVYGSENKMYQWRFNSRLTYVQ